MHEIDFQFLFFHRHNLEKKHGKNDYLRILLNSETQTNRNYRQIHRNGINLSTSKNYYVKVVIIGSFITFDDNLTCP